MEDRLGRLRGGPPARESGARLVEPPLIRANEGEERERVRARGAAAVREVVLEAPVVLLGERCRAIEVPPASRELDREREEEHDLAAERLRALELARQE